MQISFAFLLFTYFFDPEPTAVGSWRERLLIQTLAKPVEDGSLIKVLPWGCFVPQVDAVAAWTGTPALRGSWERGLF